MRLRRFNGKIELIPSCLNTLFERVGRGPVYGVSGRRSFIELARQLCELFLVCFKLFQFFDCPVHFHVRSLRLV